MLVGLTHHRGEVVDCVVDCVVATVRQGQLLTCPFLSGLHTRARKWIATCDSSKTGQVLACRERGRRRLKGKAEAA